MISYVTIGAKDPDAAVKFYDAVLAPLGIQRMFFDQGWAGYAAGGDMDQMKFLVCAPVNGEAAHSGNGAMVALDAATPDQVDAFHAAALANGGADEGAPGPRPQYGNPN